MVVASFVVACLSFLIASLSVVWQVASWFLEGRRVKVALVHGVAGRAGVLTRRLSHPGGRIDISKMRNQGFDGPEVIGIAVTNMGRATAKIDNVVIELKKGGFSYAPNSELLGPTLPLRLPPGETESWFADIAVAKALTSASKATGIEVSPRVRIRAHLGTGDTKVTRESIVP